MIYALHRQIARVRAERVQDQAQAALYPHLTKQGVREWWRGMERRARQSVSEAAALTWNGVAITGRGLRRAMRSVMGGGYSED